MADSAEGTGFWLPSEFFDDFLMDKENLEENCSAESDSEFCFPTEFPFEFGTKGNEHLEKRGLMSTSPQSTLAHMGSWTGRIADGLSNGSPNGAPSHLTTLPAAKNDAIEDLPYLTAGQVTKFELKGGDVPGPTKHNVVWAPPKSLSYPTAKNPNPSLIHNIYQKQGCGTWYSEPQMHQLRNGTAASGMGQNAWPAQRDSAHFVGTGARAVLFGGGSFGGGGAAVKRECAGTGVFLPRRYGNNVCNAISSDFRKGPGHSAVSIPNRNLSLNKSFDNTNGFAQFQPRGQTKFSRGLVPECDLLMARRHAIMLQHQRSLLMQSLYPIDCGLCLP